MRLHVFCKFSAFLVLEKAWQMFHSRRHFEIKLKKTNPNPSPNPKPNLNRNPNL